MSSFSASPKYTWYVAGRNGGVWKTENNGTSFFPVFDSTGVSSIGAIAISSSNPEIVWVGSGEAYNARSSYAGNGVYKSEDGGLSWQFMGLEDSHHISTMIIHPENPDVVWVAAMGHLFTPNEMRGIFKTADGGKSWKKVLFIDENTGVIDLIINPQTRINYLPLLMKNTVIHGTLRLVEKIVGFLKVKMAVITGRK